MPQSKLRDRLGKPSGKDLGGRLGKSLTARIFLITALMLFSASAVTFGLIAWATPITYTAVLSDDLARQTELLVQKLEQTPFNSCGPLFRDFLRASGAQVILTDPHGNAVNTGSQLTFLSVDDSLGEQAGAAAVLGETTAIRGDSTAVSGETTAVPDETAAPQPSVTVTLSDQSTIAAEVTFPDRSEPYLLYVTPSIQAENLAVQALIRMAPWLLLALLAFSLLCAFVYSRSITRPIVRLSGIAGNMARLDFSWQCREDRPDEIGQLGRSLNQLSQKLSASLQELQSANRSLLGEVERERARQRERTAFFSAASHELKTPVTILKGQLSGMLEGVGVYQDRDRYLLRALQVTGRMEHLIGEMLAISRMESSEDAKALSELSPLFQQQLELYAELLAQRGQTLAADLTPGIFVSCDAGLLGKAIGNLLSNASLYSPEGAVIRVWCGVRQGNPSLTVENTGAHIQEDALPHVFEAFYREDPSRSRSTGGSGLGLYLVQMIARRHGAACTLENISDGVRAAINFSSPHNPHKISAIPP